MMPQFPPQQRGGPFHGPSYPHPHTINNSHNNLQHQYGPAFMNPVNSDASGHSPLPNYGPGEGENERENENGFSPSALVQKPFSPRSPQNPQLSPYHQRQQEGEEKPEQGPLFPIATNAQQQSHTLPPYSQNVINQGPGLHPAIRPQFSHSHGPLPHHTQPYQQQYPPQNYQHHQHPISQPLFPIGNSQQGPQPHTKEYYQTREVLQDQSRGSSQQVETKEDPNSLLIYDEPDISMEEKRANSERYQFTREAIHNKFSAMDQNIESRIHTLQAGFVGGS
jgi:hypothetical protein